MVQSILGGWGFLQVFYYGFFKLEGGFKKKKKGRKKIPKKFSLKPGGSF